MYTPLYEIVLTLGNDERRYYERATTENEAMRYARAEWHKEFFIEPRVVAVRVLEGLR